MTATTTVMTTTVMTTGTAIAPCAPGTGTVPTVGLSADAGQQEDRHQHTDHEQGSQEMVSSTHAGEHTDMNVNAHPTAGITATGLRGGDTFALAFKDQRAFELADKQEQIETVRAEIEGAHEQIARLTASIEASERKLDELTRDMTLSPQRRLLTDMAVALCTLPCLGFVRSGIVVVELIVGHLCRLAGYLGRLGHDRVLDRHITHLTSLP